MMYKTIENAILNKNILSITRNCFDESSMICLPITISQEHLLVHFFFDFYYDGFKVLRMCDISEAKRQDSDVFVEMILKAEGVYNKIRSPIVSDVSDWKVIINSVREHYPVCMIECEELENHVFIGKVLETCEDSIRFQTFDMLAKWDDEIDTIAYSNITCLTFDDGYTTTYSKYL